MGQRDDRERRRSLLYAALGFCQLRDSPAMPEITALKQWLGTWSGLGQIVVGMERQGYALSLRKIHDDGWAATFHQHPLLAPEGFSTAATPFVAVQQAGWRALNHTPMSVSGGKEFVEEVP